VRAWVMRGTMHLVAAEDLRWLLATLGPVVIAKNARRRVELGLSDSILEQGVNLLSHILDGGQPMTRSEIAQKLVQAGLPIDVKSQALIHLIRYAALNGLVCFGPERANGDSTFVLLDEWLDNLKHTEDAPDVPALMRRYIAGYGPAGLDDFCAWSGLSKTQTTPTWQSVVASDGLIRVQDKEKNLVALQSRLKLLDQDAFSPPTVRLLPAFDAYILGYADRDLAVPREYRTKIFHGGQTVPTVMVDGIAASTWRYERRTRHIQIDAHTFQPMGSNLDKLIAQEAEDIGRFMEKRVELSIA